MGLNLIQRQLRSIKAHEFVYEFAGLGLKISPKFSFRKMRKEKIMGVRINQRLWTLCTDFLTEIGGIDKREKEETLSLSLKEIRELISWYGYSTEKLDLFRTFYDNTEGAEFREACRWLMEDATPGQMEKAVNHPSCHRRGLYSQTLPPQLQRQYGLRQSLEVPSHSGKLEQASAHSPS